MDVYDRDIMIVPVVSGWRITVSINQSHYDEIQKKHEKFGDVMGLIDDSEVEANHLALIFG